MDTVVGKNNQSSVLILVEQNSKNYFAMKLEKKNSSEVLEKLEHIVRINGLVWKIKGIITDSRKEFIKFEEMWKITGFNIYFCDPGKPQQKPLIEYMNGEFIRWFKKGTNFNNVIQQEIDWLVNFINEKLRPILNWKTAKELFLENFR